MKTTLSFGPCAWASLTALTSLTWLSALGASEPNAPEAPNALRAPAPLLIQKPCLGHGRIVFSFAGDLWVVPRSGGEARRLTSDVGTESDPAFSPDGQTIAFTGEYDGNVDLFTIPVDGGSPRRLTSHPSPDGALGWTPDGQRILFRSTRSTENPTVRLFTVARDGGFPEEVPVPTGNEGAFSPDGATLAYVPFGQWQKAWKRYRGGQTTRIWLARLADSSVEAVPRDNSNDFNPMWLGRQLYFLSDRNGPVSLFRFDPESKQVEAAWKNDGLDIKSASAGDGVIVYEQFGSLGLFDPASGQSAPVPVTIHADMPHLRAGFRKVEPKQIQNVSISPSGARVALEVRGEIVTVPAEKGDIRDLTNTPGVMERDPAWSPDGKSIAFFSDASGEYALHIIDRNGTNAVHKFGLGEPSFFYSPVWSPDSKKLVFHNKRFELWFLDLDKGSPVKIGQDYYESAGRAFDPAWSPDSKHLAFSQQLKNHFRALLLYTVETGKLTQITDGMSDVRLPVFDAGGKYLFFTASTDVGPTAGGISLASLYRPVTRHVYACVLDKTLPSPVSPEQDDEKDAKEAKDDEKKDSAKPAESASKEAGDDEKKDAKAAAEKKAKPVTVQVDLENIGQRIVPLPITPANFQHLAAGKEGILFLAEGPQTLAGLIDGPSLTIHRFDLAKRKTEKFIESVKTLSADPTGEAPISGFQISANGEKLLYRKGDAYLISQTDKADGKAIKVEGLSVFVDPIAEWRQMYHEVWRIQRDFLYDPNFHGLNLKAAEEKYRPYVEAAASRSDLNYVFEDMLGELTLGHVFIGGGDRPQAKKVKGGLLGADYKLENGRYRIAKIYSGEHWNPSVKAPLTQPGVLVSAGDYLLAVRGRELKSMDEIYSLFEDTAGKSIQIKVGPNPDGKEAHDATVVPVEDEFELRRLAWMEENRRKVDALSNGRVAYVYLPDTFLQGYRNFSRYFFAQVDKDAAVIDERFNGGGMLADYVIDSLKREVMNYVASRGGADYHEPVGVIQGPKVMIINESAGSGGDAMPWYFRRAGLGKLVGTRTWGGLVGIGDYPELMDGGHVTAPRMAIYGLHGQWEVENVGIGPDVEVRLDPERWRQGHDAQLEKAVEVVLKELEAHPIPKAQRPPYPNYHTVGK